MQSRPFACGLSVPKLSPFGVLYRLGLDRGVEVSAPAGTARQSVETKPFFSFHHVNAFEVPEKSVVVIDTCAAEGIDFSLSESRPTLVSKPLFFLYQRPSLLSHKASLLSEYIHRSSDGEGQEGRVTVRENAKEWFTSLSILIQVGSPYTSAVDTDSPGTLAVTFCGLHVCEAA